MFKLESYITPIILSYVDKYIKNFRPQDSQVSLWGGDASFHNLDLRLEVLEQELQLPFSFVSGHIHELLIHVPWTKLASEPITITINTIECILKLRGADSARVSQERIAQDKIKRNPNKRQQIETPPGYVQLLINKIVSNIRIYCNNLILKYVEEDIVLSMNVKLLTFESANEKWEPAYTDVYLSQLLMRKVIAINDLTVCLDKRNASGKIDVYQEPMLYRCSMVIHFLRSNVAGSKKSSTTRCDIYCNSMEFSMTEQQIPMLLRLIHLLQALHQKQLKSEYDMFREVDATLETEYGLEKQSFAGWAWSFVPSLLPVSHDDIDFQQMHNLGPTLQIGFYVDNASLTFKVSESHSEKSGYYSQKKLKYWPLLTLRLQGIFTESIFHGKQWSQASMGISEMTLLPIGQCSCSAQDVLDNAPSVEYLKAGQVSDAHKTDSLFDVEAPENKGERKLYHVNWKRHVEHTSEAALLERSPALAIDYLYQLTVPDDMTSENLSELGSDLEYSNLSERALLRVVVGPLRVRMCSGLLHRMSSLRAAASTYDYLPYSTPKPEPDLADLLPPSEDDYDALNEHIPDRVVQFTFLAPVVEVALMDHPFFEASKHNLFKQRKKVSSHQAYQAPSAAGGADLPKITFECQCVDLKITNPMYTKRLLRTTCQLPEPPEHMFDACYSKMSAKAIGFCSRLLINKRQTTILTPSNASYRSKTILMPQYWIDPNISHREALFEGESFTITGTNPKLLVFGMILDKFIKRDAEDGVHYMANSSLMADAVRTHGLAYLELCAEALRYNRVTTQSTTVINASLGSIKAFIIEPIDFLNTPADAVASNALSPAASAASFYSTREIQQVLILSGPEFDTEDGAEPNGEALFTLTVQVPLNPEKQTHPPLLLFNLKEIKMCVDPLLCRWLLYAPKVSTIRTEVLFEAAPRKLSRTYSDNSVYETPRRSRTPYESIHSSLDQATYTPVQKSQKSQSHSLNVTKEEEIEEIDYQEKVYNFLKKWFDVWKGLLFYGDVSQCTIYFPVRSLSAVGSQGIRQAVEETMRKANPPDIFVFTLPSAKVRNSSHRDNLAQYLSKLPIVLPENFWSANKSSFPWNLHIADLSCYTWQNGVKVDCLAPVSLTSTVGMSTKSASKPSQDVGHLGREDYKSMENIFQINFSGNKSDIGTFGVCVHIDMTPIVVSISEPQVCLIASVLHGLIEVAYNILPEPKAQVLKLETTPQIPAAQAGGSNLSPTILKESVDSLSEKQPHVPTDHLETENIKLTAWIQWTITRFTVNLLARDNALTTGDGQKSNLKFVIDAEDIVSSLDFQNVYLKLKSKIGSASVMHYVKDSDDRWRPGEFLGLVLRVNEEPTTTDRQEDTSFASITITRASCQHTHSLWGANKHKKGQKNKGRENDDKERENGDDKGGEFVHSRYMTEIMLTIQPIDLLVSPVTLKNYFLVLEPLLQIPSLSTQPRKSGTSSCTFLLSNRSLPLTYIEFNGFRVIMPSVDMAKAGNVHNACVFQVNRINLTPSAVNPICRTPCRPDIYQQAAQARILNVPGSEMEDRQYQLDIAGICMNSGSWTEISQLLKQRGKTMSLLKTMSENPALEWNNLEKGKPNAGPEITYWSLISKFDISVIYAPAMIYKSDIICGHSVEVNFISDIGFTVSLEQIKLIVALADETLGVCDVLLSEAGVVGKPKVIFPYPIYRHASDVGRDAWDADFEITKDSGIETQTSDLRSSFSLKTKDSAPQNLRKMSEVSEKSALNSTTSPGFLKPSLSTTALVSFVPLDVLVTSGKVSLALYEFETCRRGETRFFKENESDKGYEASEEESVVDEKTQVRRFIPLVYFSLSQPNAFMSDTLLGRKMQISCYDVCIKVNGHGHHKNIKGIPSEDDFGTHLLETKSGEPHVDTGVLPAFLTLKWSKGIGKPATLDVDIAKPTKIMCSLTKWLHLLQIQDKLMSNVIVRRSRSRLSQDLEIGPPPGAKDGHGSKCEHYLKYEVIKKKFNGLSHVNLKMSQMMFAIQTKNDVEINLSFCNLSNNLSIQNRPEKLLNTTSIECITMGSVSNGESRLILNPWTVSFEVALFWESWQSVNSSPQMQISAESDSIVLDISPDKILYLQDVVDDFQQFGNSMPRAERSAKAREPAKDPATEREQHYKDDLRAGAFHFVDSTSNNIDELPLPYQVVFWNRNVSAMAWRYPQPRALTKVRVFPVPFKISTGNEEDEQILCHLEYWSDCHGCYRTYTQFYLSETDMCHLELPKNYPQPAVACTWRVVLTAPLVKDFHQSRVLISPRALAGCIRVDSYFNKNLIPQLTLALHVASVNVNLINYVDKRANYVMPKDVRKFACDMLIPEYQHFLTLTIDNANAYLATWKFEMAVFDVNCTAKCVILDYAYLTHQQLIDPFAFKFEISLAQTIGLSVIAQPIRMLFGAGAAHTLAVSAQLWSELLQCRQRQEDSVDFVLLTRYVICNDTNLTLRFGQAGVEDIFLPSRHCHLYSWRSQKCKQVLRIAMEENRNLMWSAPFSIERDGTEICKMADEHTQIVVTVRSLSATQKQVIFSGQFFICNTLLEHFEMKVVQAVTKEKEREFKLTPSHIIRGKSTPPSMLLDCSKSYFLRLRFYGLESAWSGDIPLLENTKCAQPWLVKVPLQERGQFLSIWCRIVVQNYPDGKKILAMMWPLFMIRSNLPISAKVHIETPTLNVHLESTVKGHGEIQQLYCPGTIDHSHQLTFQLDNALSNSNPYVPLNYSLVDQKQFFKKAEKEDIAEVLEAIDEYDKHPWPYFRDDYEDVEFVADDQPLTHVQVRYQNATPHSSALLVELLPWSLMVNMLGCQVAILVNEKELCRINHNGIITPPKLEETFCIGVGLGSTWNVSGPLQLAKSNWSQAFYMPSITGTIPFDGHIKTVVHCEPYICVVTILSSIYNEIRLLRLTSSHVLTNHLKMQLYVVCFALPDSNQRVNVPPYCDKHSFVMPPQLDKSNSGMPIMQWLQLEHPQNSSSDYALYVAFATNLRYGWSCPIRVDKFLARRSVAVPHEARSVPIVLVAQEAKGQAFLAVHHDLHPQLLIENRCGTKIFCAQFKHDQSDVVQDTDHFNWLCAVENQASSYYSMPVVAEKFPELPPVNYSEMLVLAAADESDLENIIWSTPINVANLNDQFVRVPYHGDVKAVVEYAAHAVRIRVESVSQVEISARDIRVRLSLHESEARHARKHVAAPNDTVSTTPATSYFSAEDSARTSASTENMLLLRPDGRYDECATTSCSDYEEDVAAQPERKPSVIRVMTFFKGLIFTLTSDLENGGAEKKEVISVSCDDIAITVTRAEISQIVLSVSNVQIDNQLFARGAFDFPVVLVSQDEGSDVNLRGFNVPINQLVYDAQENNVIRMDMNVESWRDVFLNENVTDVRDIHIKIQPISIFLEDIYLMKLMEYLAMLQPTKLVLWPPRKRAANYRVKSTCVPVPLHLKYGSIMLARPVRLKNFSIDEISILLSVHASVKLYIALDQSPLHFGKFDKKRLFTTYYRLGHAMTMHYISGAIFGAGWVVSSLELIGSPGGLARAMGSGLRDFVSLPYHGLVQGPWAFLRGVSYGSASLMKHVTAGTLQSVTKLASSVARNLDRLTLDAEHLRRTEESRRQRPQGLTQGFVQGLTGLGISLLGAVGGIAHHPLQSVMAEGATPRSLVAGVGRGIVGVFTKPLSGAAELVALTGQGLLQGAGWNKLPEPRMTPTLNHIFSSTNSIVKYKWKFLQTVTQSNILFVTEATAITNVSQYDAVALVLTSEALIIVDIDEDMTQRVLGLSELSGAHNNDPTLLCLRLEPPKVVTKIVEDDVVLEMDPACRARVADYVRNTVGLMQMPSDRGSTEHSEMSISPDVSPCGSPGRRSDEATVMTYYVSPQSRNYFLCLLALAKQQTEHYYFPVL